MVWMGTFTQTFLPAISAQNAQILRIKANGIKLVQRLSANGFDNFMPTSSEYLRVLPEIILTLVGVLIMFLEAACSTDDRKGIFAPLSIAGLAAALVAPIMAYGDPGPAFQNMLLVDGFATFFRVLVIAVGMLAVFSSTDYLRREDSKGGEFYALILFSVVGQSIMASANELIMIFIGLEISSIASYILAGYLRDDPRNNESALKYFLLGSFATAFLLVRRRVDLRHPPVPPTCW